MNKYGLTPSHDQCLWTLAHEIGIVDIINRLLGTHPLEEVSVGHVVKALILNCLGFLTAPLYLFSQFFEGKATEHWIGPGDKGVSSPE